MISSVDSGLISLTEPTIVVLPTPKPPTTTIFRPWLADFSRGLRTWAASPSESL
jgi:hypothetical protein